MNRKSWFYCGVCLVAGLAVGYFCAQARDGRAAANMFAILKFMDLGESSERAMHAYQHEGGPVGIYALTEYLDKQTAYDQMGNTNIFNKKMMAIDMMLTHARLAKLYTESGQTNLSEQHIAEALNYAQDGMRLITNEVVLMDFVAKLDKVAK
jgi:hypothetical protein